MLQYLCLLFTFFTASFGATPAVKQISIFDESVKHSSWNTTYYCFRVPSVIHSAKSNTILAFVESRIGSCGDQAPKDVTMRRSTDGGITWGPLVLVVGPIKHKTGVLDFSSRNPYAVVDIQGNVILQYVDSTNPMSCHNYQMISEDDGKTFSKPGLVNLGKWNGTLMGPGNGIMLGRHSASTSSGRLVICGASGYVGNMSMYSLVWWSDDHGLTWVPSKIPKDFMNMQECQVVELNNGSLVINMRNGIQHDRAISMSLDGGTSFESIWYDEELPDPTCSAGLINFHGTLYFSNNPTLHTRKNMTLKSSTDNGISWKDVVQLTNNPSAYSVIVPVDDQHVAVVYETGKSSPYEKIVFASVDVGAGSQYR